jgi:general secretion pathway protein L
MFSEFLTWWSQQLGSLASPLLIRLRDRAPDALLLIEASGEDGFKVVLRRRGRLEALADMPTGLNTDLLRRMLANHPRQPLVLSLARRALLRDIWLPAAAEGSLDRVLEYEMDRFTPFRTADVFFAYRLKAHDRAGGKFLVELAMVPKAWLHPLLEALDGAGLSAEALETSEPDQSSRRILLHRTASSAQLRQRTVRRMMVAATGALAAAVLLLPVLRQSLALAAIDIRVADLRPRVEQAELFRQRIAAGTAGAGRIAAARQQTALPLTVLADVTGVLPDDTWLTGLTLRQNHLIIEGRSHGATRLIAALAAQPQLRNPAFAAPVVHADTGEEIFTIQAEVAP